MSQEYLGRGLALDIDCTQNDMRRAIYTKALQLHPLAVSVDELMSRHYYFQEVPEWKANPEVMGLEKLFHDEVWLANLPLMSGVQEGIQYLREEYEIAGVITTRPESIRKLTQKWLGEHDLITHPLEMAPQERAYDDRWKSQRLGEYHHVWGIVEDHRRFPEHINDRTMVFWFGHERYDGPKKNIIPCATWKDVVREVEQRCPEQYRLSRPIENSTP